MFNRDMDLSRPTLKAHFWKEDPNIIGGRDVSRGGSWLLLNIKTGNIAFLTNIDECFKPFNIHAESRGKLITDFVSSSFFSDFNCDKETGPEVYLNLLLPRIDSFNYCSLVVGNVLSSQTKFCLLSFLDKKIYKLEPDKLHGLSNSVFTSPYPKVIKTTNLMDSEFSQNNEESVILASAWSILNCQEVMEPEKGLEAESSIFVRPYWMRKFSGVVSGTQSQMVILLDSSNHVTLQESTTFIDEITWLGYSNNPSILSESPIEKLRRCVKRILARIAVKHKGYLKFNKSIITEKFTLGVDQ